MKRTLALSCFLFACGGGTGSGGGQGHGKFPDISTLAQKVVPIVGGGSAARDVVYDSGASAASDWANAEDWVSEILGPNDGGVDTKVLIQLDRVKTIINEINSQYSSATGDPASCTTTLSSSDHVTVPFFGANATPIFWASQVDDSHKYQCFVHSGSGGFMFGRAAISDAPASCTDPNEYFIVNGNSLASPTQTYELQKIYYNGCTTQLGLAMSLTDLTTASSDGEFDARFELLGTVSSGAFQMRIAKLDVNGASGTFPLTYGQFSGAGEATAASGVGHLIFSYDQQACTDAATCSDSDGSGGSKAHTWCLTTTPNATAGAAATYVVDDTTADCASNEANFSALVPFALADISRAYIDFSSSTPFGL